MKPPPFSLPESERGRQAVAAIRGYAYQLISSALAWASLAEEEVLLLEVADDFAIMAKDALTTVQIKDTPSQTASLNSKGVVDTLNSHWRLAASNPELDVRSAYLTTSNIAQERPAISGVPRPGLLAWRQAGLDEAIALVLKAHLCTDHRLDADFRAWLDGASAAVFQERLVRRVRWVCGQPDLGALDSLLAERLISIGDRHGIPPMEARRARHAVLHAVLLSAADPTNRLLTRAGFLETVAEAVTVTVPISTLQALLSSSRISPAIVSRLFIDVGAIPSRAGNVDRSALRAQLNAGMADGRPIWLHGPSGTGKTTAAVGLGRKSNRAWRLIELRGVSGDALAERLRSAREVAADPETEGLILDDFPADQLQANRIQLGLLAAALNLNDGRLVFTSDRSPQISVAEEIGPGIATVLVSNLDEAEVAGLVAGAGGDTQTWAQAVWLSSGGHPQLVAARVAGLKRRGWPLDETLQGLLPHEAAEDVDDERRAVRVRLWRELDPAFRSLLYRLSIPLGGFDRALAMSVASASPALPMAGEAFDFLIGPWLETSRRDRYRVSPLVADSGTQTFSKDEVAAIHAAICRDLAARRPIQGDHLGQMLVSGLIAEDEDALQAVVTVVILTKPEDYRGLAYALEHLVLFSTDRWLLHWDHDLSARLRLAQLKIAAVKADRERALAVYDRLAFEARSFEGQSTFMAAAAVTIFSGDQNLFRPRDWFRVVRSLENETMILTPSERTRLTGATGYAASEVLSDFMFVWASMRLRSIAELEELFAVLDTEDRSVRDRYLATLDDIWVSLRTLVQTSWLQEVDSADFSAEQQVGRYQALAAKAAAWEQGTLALECVAAQAILLSEYAGEHQRALDVLSEARRRWPAADRLARERTKILFRLDRHAEVVEEGEAYLAAADGDPVERVYALRELAVSQSKLGRFADAALTFGRAAEVADALRPLTGMKAALIADRAFVEFQHGHRETALRRLVEAAGEAEAVDRETPRGGYVIRMLAGMGSWMVAMLGNSAPKPGEGMVVGACSGPEAPGDWPGPVPQKEVIWYEIAAVERGLDLDLGLRARVAERVSGRRIGAFEIAFALEALVLQSRDADPTAFVDACVVAAQILLLIAHGGVADPTWAIHQVSEIMPWETLPIDMETPAVRLPVEDAVIAFMADCVLIRRTDLSQELAAALFSYPAFQTIAADVLCWRQRETPGSDAMTSALWAISVVGGGPTADCDSLALATFRMWEWLDRSSSAKDLQADICRSISERWLHVVDQASFALRSPALTAPRIKAAAWGLATRAGIARLLLEVDGAVELRMGADVREVLKASSAEQDAADRDPS